MLNFTYILLAVIFVFLNAFFVAAEFSFARLRNTRVKLLSVEYGFIGKTIEKIHQSLDSYLSVCQLGITLASLALGWIGEPAFVKMIEPFLKLIGISTPSIIKGISIVISFTTITFLHVVVGEVVPKSLALRMSEKLAYWTAIPLYCFHWLTYPVTWFLNKCSLTFLKIFGMKSLNFPDLNYSADEIKLIISSSQIGDEIPRSEIEILENTLEFSDLKVVDLMHTIDEMIAINILSTIPEMIKIVAQNRYSRYPIYQNEKSNVIGIVHVKDILSLIQQGQQMKSLEDIMRPILSVSHELPVTLLLKQFKEGKSHFSVVKNEINKIIGYVTLDNVLSALLGNIHDEFNQIRDNWVTLNDGTFLMKGSTPIYSLEKALNIELPKLDVNTINGFITHQIERIPNENEIINFDLFSITIRKVKGSHILLVKVKPKNKN